MIPTSPADPALAPTVTERLARARADLRIGVPVVLVSGDRAALVLAAETGGADRLAVLDKGRIVAAGSPGESERGKIEALLHV